MFFLFGSENHLKLDVKEEESESEEGMERTVMVDLANSVVDEQERSVIILMSVLCKAKTK